jgi:hypothetical protein
LGSFGDRLLADLDIHEAVPSGSSVFSQRQNCCSCPRNIALSTRVSASGVRRCRFDERALLAHDPAHKHSFKKPAIEGEYS